MPGGPVQPAWPLSPSSGSTIRPVADPTTYRSPPAVRDSLDESGRRRRGVDEQHLPVGSYRPPIRPSPTRVVTSPLPSSRQWEMTGVFSLKVTSSRPSALTAMSPTMPCWGSRTTPVGRPVARSAPRGGRPGRRVSATRRAERIPAVQPAGSSATAIELQALAARLTGIVQRMEPVDVSTATAASSPAAMSSPASVTITWLFDDSSGAVEGRDLLQRGRVDEADGAGHRPEVDAPVGAEHERRGWRQPELGPPSSGALRPGSAPTS